MEVFIWWQISCSHISEKPWYRIIFPPDLNEHTVISPPEKASFSTKQNPFKVLRLRGIIPRDTKWDVVVDLFFYREPEEAEKEEQAAKEAVAAVVKPAEIAAPIEPQDLDWTTTEATEWSAEPVAPVPPVAGAAPFAVAATDDWATEVAQEQWTATNAPAAPAPNWGGTTDWH